MKPTGVYALAKVDGQISLAMLRSPLNEGIAIRVSWDKLQPTAGGPVDFSYLDSFIAAVKAVGKKCTIYVCRTASWLRVPGGPAGSGIDFYDKQTGEPRWIPVPWNREWWRAWRALIWKLSERYKDEETVVAWRGATDEFSVGWAFPDINLGSYLYHGAPMTGVLFEALMIGVLVDSVNLFRKAFPRQHIFCALGVFEGQPSGRLYIARQVVERVREEHDDTVLSFWKENLHGNIPPAPGTDTQWEPMMCAAAQMVWHVQDLNEEHRMNQGKPPITPNDKPTVLHAAFAKGMDYGIDYFEVYPPDIADPDLESLFEWVKAVVVPRPAGSFKYLTPGPTPLLRTEIDSYRIPGQRWLTPVADAEKLEKIRQAYEEHDAAVSRSHDAIAASTAHVAFFDQLSRLLTP